MLPCRDNEGAIRILNMGNLPFPQDLKDFHAARIAERAKYEKRAPSFQMVIDDVYAIGKGRLVGRPRNGGIIYEDQKCCLRTRTYRLLF